ncbi:MAG TPA: hypothetical protein PLO17_19590, partial [Alcaligenes phenolicus]|uniref:hypothetical protein n=1 Tax=Alcaligenes phenolicus TaxID=232846 RepID=UPI002BAAC0AE
MPSPRTLQHWAVVGFALLAALLVTAFATIHQSRSNERMARLRFDELTRAATAHVEQRVRAYAGRPCKIHRNIQPSDPQRVL